MARSRESFNKKEIKTKKEKKRKEKDAKKIARKENKGPGEEFAYVDENGMLSSTPPDPSQKLAVDIADIQISIPRNQNIQKPDPIRKGFISLFNESKGFGFIKDSQNNESIFVHINNTLEPVKEGNKVTFEMERGPKGFVAKQVRIDR